MNAYELLISNQSADTQAGEMALGHLMAHLRRSQHAAAVGAETWPAGWRVYGAAVITPAGTMLVLTEDHGEGTRGAQFQFDVIRIGEHVKGVDGDPPYHLTAVGIPAIKAAVWSVLREWGTPEDASASAALLGCGQ